jgi:N-acyl-D-aspartate/D-glutamate deacylase
MRPLLVLACIAASGCATGGRFDVIIRHGTVYDGGGGAGVVADVGIRGDTIAAVGRLEDARAAVDIDARGLAVAPGFINMLSHAEESLIQDRRAESDIRQGVTLEVLGEASMGPLNERLKREYKDQQNLVRYEIEWDTLGGYLDWLERRRMAPNVASFVGAGTVRALVVGEDARAATPAELDAMRAEVARAMEEGALGLTTALQYAPDSFATTEELVALARVASTHGGVFTAHMRNEGNHIEAAVAEMLTIAREAEIPVEIYHFKMAGKPNWGKLDQVVAMIDDARAAGVAITADMYTYEAAATGLDAAMPPWVQAGGFDAWVARLRDPEVRGRVAAAMRDVAATDWDNAYANSGPDRMLLVEFKNLALRRFTGKTLAEVAALRGKSPEETAMDLVIEDTTRVGVIYFSMSEDNVRRELTLPWMSFCSDAGALAPGPPFTDAAAHPRAYGSFARLLGRYVRDEHVLTLAEAIRRLTSLPAGNLKLDRRGRLAPGYFADVVVFDPARIGDRATYQAPHQLATGVEHVWVNGVQVLGAGQFTGKLPGRVVRGPGWKRAVSSR